MEQSFLGAIIAFVIVLFLGPRVIPLLHRLKFGQVVREDGPSMHKIKTGTPTMGGLMILAGMIAGTLATNAMTTATWLLMITTLSFGGLGFLDDYIKVVLKRNLGLKARQKLLGQVLISVVFAIVASLFLQRGTSLWIPIFNLTWDMGILFFGLVFFVLVGTTNAVNLTDGLDGLAAGTSIAAMSFYAFISWFVEKPEIAAFFLAMIGATAGFLVFNRHPARIFMGDTGSLALGGALAGGAILTGTELVLVLVGGVFVLEAMSVILQVASFKSTGKRIFRMSPLHHHFELGGWPETKVVKVFCLWGILFGLAGLLMVKTAVTGRLI